MPVSNQKEEIDERILRLLGLDDVFDLDYDTYLTLLKEAMIKGRMVNKTIPTEELMLLDDEYKRVKNEKEQGRFKVNKKKISVSSFSIGDIKKKITAVGPTRGLLGAAETIAKAPIQKGLDDNITSITTAVVSISETLKRQNKLFDDASAYNKRKEEQEKRGLAESKLEKRFDGLKKLAEKIIAPVKSVLDRILQFLTTVILGRIVYKLVEWLGDKDNADKVRSIIRFLGDHWPKLLALYLTFGTSFGKFARGLVKLVARSAFKLGALILKLAAAKKVRGARRAAGFLGGRGGRAVSAVIGTAVTLGGTYAATQVLKGPDEEPKAQAYKGGGYVIPKIPTFKGGGFNFKGMLGGASLGAMFGPLGMLLGGAFGSGKPQEMMSGFVSGEKGVDKVPAMLSDGEFVMSRGAVAKYGVDTLEAMNAAGGGTNKPKIMSGTTYAQGGGMIGDIPLASSYGANPDVDTLRRAARVFRQFGTEEDLFKAFKKLNGVPDFAKMVGGENIYERIFQGHHGYDDALDAIRQSVADKVKAVNNPQSFTQSSRAAAGLDDLAKKFDMDAKTAPRYTENLPKLNKPKPNLRGQFTNLKPDYFLRGQFSNLPADYFSKAAKNVRAPIPATSAIVPYTGGGLSKPPIQKIYTNMNVPTPGGGALSKNVRPRGYGGALQAAFAAMEFVDRKNQGQTNAQAGLGAAGSALGGQVGWMAGAKGGALIGGAIGAMFGGVGAAPGAAIGAIIGGVAGGFGGASLGGKLADDLSGVNAAKERLGRGGIGGKIMGGYGLKEQSFKDAPKTQVMSDDKGKPFIGYKAMRNGKIVYVRGPQPGTGTSNPLEALGRMINPGAYKDVDSENARKKYDEAARGSISSLKARGATQATIAKRQAELNKRKPVKPPTKTKPKVVVAGGGMNGRRGSGSRPSTPNVPNFSASNKSRSKINILGITI